jgi:diguanylate cyclase (GGDEF)-like protein/PAS domain S-box-containing protein
MPEKTNAAPMGESTLDHLLVQSLAEYAIFVVSPAGLILRWNLGAEALFGYTGDEAIGKHFGLLFTPEDVAAGAPDSELAEALLGPLTGHDRWHVRKDGSRFWGMNTAHPLYDERHSLLGFTKIVRDLTERYLAAEALRESAERLQILVKKTQHEALHDDLTSLANKPLFREYLGRAISRSERHPERTFAVLFLDLDGFKTMNARLGHVRADRLLRQVSRRLQQAVRTEDVLARLGGDEFAILIEDIDGAPEAILIAEHVLESFRASFTIEGTEVATSASIGIAVASAHGSNALSVDRILEDADLAMYAAKSQGRSRFVVFRDVMRTRAKVDLELNNDLREALERDELRMFYEPVVDVRTRKISGFEGRPGWQHPKRGLLSRAEFRARAEESGLLVGIDLWAISKAAHHLRSWQRDFNAPALTMSLNLSAMDLERHGLGADLHAILAEAALPARSLALVIGEPLPTESLDRIGAVLTEIRTTGFDIYLDDFGGGGASFGHLSRLPVTALKIDRSFVAKLESDEKSVSIIRAMIAFARSLGLKSIAGGVETENQLAILGELGCDRAQGTLFSEPMTADDARTFIAPSVHPPMTSAIVEA